MRESTELFFAKSNAIYLAIVVVVGTQFRLVIDALAQDLIMPLVNPLMPNGDWHDLVIPYLEEKFQLERFWMFSSTAC